MPRRPEGPGLVNAGERQITVLDHDSGVDMVRFGRGVRALRIRRRWRQVDLAAAASVGPSIVVRIERGRADTVPPRKLDKVAQALGARLDLRLSWNGEALDRLLDGDHARLVEAAAAHFRSAGWEVAAEVTFWIRGERGSVDLLAWHAPTRMLLVIEVKSVVPDIQAMLSSLDRKTRLAIEIAQSRGWSPIGAGKLLVIGDTRTSRRRVEALATTFDAEYPHRAVQVRRWIANPLPSVPLRGLWFLSLRQGMTVRHRVRRP
jgi:transcriptional regulator with XRE-family HTH domain